MPSPGSRSNTMRSGFVIARSVEFQVWISIIPTCAAGVRVHEGFPQAFALERPPPAFGLREAVRHGPPRARVHTHADVARDDFDVLHARVAESRVLHAALPRDDAVAARIDARGRHR